MDQVELAVHHLHFVSLHVHSCSSSCPPCWVCWHRWCMRVNMRAAGVQAVTQAGSRVGGADVMEPAGVAPWFRLVSNDRLVVAVVDGAAFVNDDCAH